MRFRLTENNIPLLATAAVCLCLFGAGAVRYYDDRFFTVGTVVDMLTANAVLGVVAVGMTFVILSGGIDLSVASVVALTGVVVGWAVQRKGVHPALAVPCALAGGAAFGAAMGCLIHFFRMPAFMVTLAGMFLARGLGFLISVDPIALGHPWYDRASEWVIPLGPVGRLGGGTTPGLPFPAVVFLVALAAAAYVARLTGFGRNVYAVGGNEHSSLLMGLPVGRTKIAVYALSGFCAALGGVVYTVKNLSGDPDSVVALELDAIAAVVIGGTLLTGGVGHVIGTLLGVLILAIIQTSIAFEGSLSSGWTRVAIGLLLFTFIALQRLLVKVSSGGAGWLTRRRRGREVRPAAGA
jgi:simple sugar transport system permease protein